MRSIIILLFACLALTALADDNASHLEKTDEDSSVNLSEGIDKLSGRLKREENPLLVSHQRTRRHADDCDISCRKGSCYCKGKSCSCWCTTLGRPKCKARSNNAHTCRATCKKRNCDVSGRCVKCRCSIGKRGYCKKCNY